MILVNPYDICLKKTQRCRFLKEALNSVPRKRCSKNMQQIYRRTNLPKCDLNKVAKQLY